jgi:diguanylate cyclase (GGDEF)-like protein
MCVSSLRYKLLVTIGGPAFLLALGGTGWLVHRSHATDAALHSALTAVMLFGATLVMATFVSLHFFLIRPLARLSSVMRMAEQGDVLVRADVRGRDEIGQLSVAFNRMLENMTAIKAEEIDAQNSLAVAQEQLSLQEELEKSHLELEQRVNHLSLLYDVAKSLTSTLELPELLGRISTIVATRLHFRRFSLMLLTEDKLEVKVALPPTTESSGVRFAVGEGACGHAAKTLKTVYIPDLSQDPTFVARARKNPSGSLLAVPIVHQGNLLGVFNFERPQMASFDEGDIELLSAVADQVAMAVQNARLHEETVALSITDPLTGVPNRRHLFARLEMEVARGQRFGAPVSFVMVDIDHFKKLNDAAGHRAGDVTLKEVADLLKGHIRKVDTVARYGGEEFAFILPQSTKAEAVQLAEKLRRAVEQHPFTYGKSQPGGRVTISLGVSSFSHDAGSLDALVDAADASLYASKRGGRNLVTAFSPGMELHPGRERGPHARRTRSSGEMTALKSG